MKPTHRLCLGLMLLFTASRCERVLAGSSEAPECVAITNVSVPATCVQGDTVPIVVTVVNRGVQKQSFTVRLIDTTTGTEIASKSLMLSAVGTGGIDEIFDLAITGEVEGPTGFGDSAGVGDVNGDGCGDLLVAAAMYNHEQGRAYLYYGGKAMDDKADKRFTGENIGDGFACCEGVCLADMNNDGFDDVIVGARLFDRGRGRVYIFHGGPDMDEKPDVILEAESGVKDCNFGRGIEVGDMNGDGHQDLAVTAIRYKSYTGRTYLYYGPITSDTSASKMFTGENVDDAFGEQIATGDIDRDGCDDLLIGTLYYPRGKNQGRAYLFYGAAGTSMDETPDLIFDGEHPGDALGAAVELFDVDGDGHADVLIAAHRWPGNDTFPGRAYLYWGSDRTSMDNVPDLTFTGEADAAASLGGRCIMGGYVNSDGYGDILFASYNYYQLCQHGRAYLFYGNAKSSMDTVYDRAFTGEEAMCQPQRARIADFNGDGCGDIAMFGYTYHNCQGRIWIWYGEPEDSISLTFRWDTRGVRKGKHVLRIEAGLVSGEVNTKDNIETATVQVEEAL